MTLPLPKLSYVGASNRSVVDQLPAAATATVLLGSVVQIPVDGLKVGSRYRFKATVAKSAAGTGTSAYIVRYGVLGTVADAALITFTKPAGDATADEGVIEIDVVVRVNSAVGVLRGAFRMTHNLASTGHMTIPGAAVYVESAATDITGSAGAYLSVSVTSGAADALTFHYSEAELVL